MKRALLIAATAAALATWSAPPALAQDSALSVNRPAAAQRPDFDQVVDQDVANHYYSQAEGDQLKASADAATERMEQSFSTLETSVNRNVLIGLDNQQLQNQISSISSGRVGATPDEINEQAAAIVDGVNQVAQTANAVVQTAQPVVQDCLDQMDQVVAQRAQLISANKNIPAAVRLQTEQQSAALHATAQGQFDRAMGTVSNQLQQVQANVANNRQQLIQATATKLTQLSQQYGPDTSQWPTQAQQQPQQQQTAQSSQPNPPTQSDQPPQPGPQTQPQPTTDDTQPQPNPTPPPGGQPTKGVIPGSQGPDDAFNAYRNYPGGVAPQPNPPPTPSPPPQPNPAPPSNPAPQPPPQQPPPPGPNTVDRAEDELPPPNNTGPTVDQYINNPYKGKINTGIPQSGSDSGSGAGGSLGDALQNADQQRSIEQQILNTIQPGNLGQLMGGGPFPELTPEDDTSGLDLSSLDLSGDDASDQGALQTVDYGDDVSMAQVAPIYAGYQTGGSTGGFMVSPSMQVQAPSDVMTSPSMQVATGQGAALSSPSMQVSTGASPPTATESQAPEPALCGE